MAKEMIYQHELARHVTLKKELAALKAEFEALDEDIKRRTLAQVKQEAGPLRATISVRTTTSGSYKDLCVRLLRDLGKMQEDAAQARLSEITKETFKKSPSLSLTVIEVGTAG